MHWIYLLATWTLFLLLILSIWRMVKDIVQTTKRLHQIPCANCHYFTGNYYLKCPVHPTMALTEESVHCPDYHPGLKAPLIGNYDW